MQCRKGQVTRFGNGQRTAHGLVIAHFADKHHVRVLTEGHLQGHGKAVRIATNFTLVDHATLVLVQEFNRVFDRKDMLVAFLVNLVDHGGKSRGLTRTRSTRHQH